MRSGSKYLYKEFTNPKAKCEVERYELRWVLYLGVVQLALQLVIFTLILGEMM